MLSGRRIRSSIPSRQKSGVAALAALVLRVLVAVLMPADAAAQIPSPTGNVYGTALDQQGNLLPGLTVTLAGPGAPRAATTDAKGDFRFLNLPPGRYSVTLERKGFETVRREVTVLLGKNAVLSLTMSVAGAAEAVTVSGQAPVVDSRKTETGANYGRKELQSIPTTRDPWAIVRQVPGVLLADTNVGGDAWLWQSGFVGKGSDSGQNTFNLDGVGITDIWGTTPVSLDFDSLDGIEIATGGSDPSLATPGVTVNLVTKRGTNQILGSARVLYNGTAGWDYGAEVGGPIWKDRVWLWAAGASNAFLGQTFVTDIGQPVQSKDTIDHWNAKLNAQLASANSLVFSYVNSSVLGEGDEAGPSRSQPSTVDDVVTTSGYRIEDSQVLSARLFATAYFSYLALGGTSTPQGGLGTQADVLDFVWQNSFMAFKGQRPQQQAGLTASGFFDTARLRHELKFGFGYRSIQLDSTSSWPGDEFIGSEFSSPSTSGIPPNAAITRRATVKARVNYYNVYLGDTIQADNITVNLGARFDYQQAKNLPSEVPANPVLPEILPAVQYAGDSGYPITWRQFQPRIGATYSLGTSGLVRASYSRFGSRLNSEIKSIDAFPGPATLWYPWNDLNGNHRVEPNEFDFSQLLDHYNVDTADPGSVVPVNQIAKGFQPAVTDEFIVGAERQILPDLSASVAYTHRSVHQTAYTPVIGTSRSSYEYFGNAAGSVTSEEGFVLNFSEPYYGLTTCPAPCSGTVLTNRPDFTQTYDGLEVQLIKPLSHGWMVRASFAYNDWQQHVGPGAITDPNNMVGGSNASGPVVQGGYTRFGTNYVNAMWQFNVSALAQLPLGIEVGANLFGRQGYPIVYSVLVFTGSTNNFATENQIGQVGAYRNPAVLLLDLHVQKTFRIGSRFTISPVLDCFNAPNVHTVLQRQGFVGVYDANPSTPVFTPNDGFNDAAERLSSRVFRGGVQIAF